MKQLLEILQSGTAYLEKRKIDEARLNMEHLLAQYLQLLGGGDALSARPAILCSLELAATFWRRRGAAASRDRPEAATATGPEARAIRVPRSSACDHP